MLAPALFKTTEGRFGEPRNGSIRHILIVIIEKLRPISNGSIFDGSVPPSLFQVECSLLRTGRRRDIYHASRVATAQFARSDRVLPAAYQHAIDSGVYLQGVDSSYVGDRKPVALEAIGRNPAVLLAIGQSNIANHGGKQFSSGQAVFNFNPFDGQCYPAADPLLGATGDLGSPLCILGDALINSGFAGSIVLCALAVGGATVANWAPGGPYHTRLTYALARLKGLRTLPFTCDLASRRSGRIVQYERARLRQGFLRVERLFARHGGHRADFRCRRIVFCAPRRVPSSAARGSQRAAGSLERGKSHSSRARYRPHTGPL